MNLRKHKCLLLVLENTTVLQQVKLNLNITELNLTFKKVKRSETSVPVVLN